MRKKHTGRSLTAILCGLALSASLLTLNTHEARAQQASDPTMTPPQQQDEQGERVRRPGARRQNDAASLLAQLNLTPEQRAQLVEIRRLSAPEAQALMQRLNRARRALEAAIYATQPDEAQVEERLREVTEAQAAVVRMRALTELRVRRVLTPAQLELFRQLRRQSTIRQRLERRARRRGAQNGLDAPRRTRPKQ